MIPISRGRWWCWPLCGVEKQEFLSECHSIPPYTVSDLTIHFLFSGCLSYICESWQVLCVVYETEASASTLCSEWKWNNENLTRFSSIQSYKPVCFYESVLFWWNMDHKDHHDPLDISLASWFSPKERTRCWLWYNLFFFCTPGVLFLTPGRKPNFFVFHSEGNCTLWLLCLIYQTQKTL